jgi:predicted Zn-dependent protease
VVLHRGEIRQSRVIVRAVVGGGEGVAYTNDLSADGLAQAREHALHQARLVPADPDHPGLPTSDEAGEPAKVDPWDGATAEGDFEAETQDIGEALAACRAHGADLAGIVERCGRARAVVNSRGLVRSSRATHARARLIATCGEGSGHGGTLVGRSDQLALGELGDKAGRVAAASQAPVEVEPGRYDVLLEPEAVIELLTWFGMIAFGAQSVAEGTSFLAGTRGQDLTGTQVNLYDPGPEAALLPVSFDAEGVARQRVDFVVQGRGGEAVHDRLSARRAGCSSTGHWRTSDIFPEPGPGTEAIVFGAGEDSGSLLEKLGDGLHVHRFHYVNGFLDPKKARMTGLTRDGLFQVRGGELGPAVKDLRFTENLLEAFSRIDGLGDKLHSVAGFWGDLDGACAAPRILIRDFLFSSGCAAD